MRDKLPRTLSEVKFDPAESGQRGVVELRRRPKEQLHHFFIQLGRAGKSYRINVVTIDFQTDTEHMPKDGYIVTPQLLL